jgi:hypothetical protein
VLPPLHGLAAIRNRKIGVIARNALTANSLMLTPCVHGDGLTSLQFRPGYGTNSASSFANQTEAVKY